MLQCNVGFPATQLVAKSQAAPFDRGSWATGSKLTPPGAFAPGSVGFPVQPGALVPGSTSLPTQLTMAKQSLGTTLPWANTACFYTIV